MMENENYLINHDWTIAIKNKAILQMTKWKN